MADGLCDFNNLLLYLLFEVLLTSWVGTLIKGMVQLDELGHLVLHLFGCFLTSQLDDPFICHGASDSQLCILLCSLKLNFIFLRLAWVSM